MASAAPRRSPGTSVRSPASMATSVPVPMARPRSAWARAAASLTPSPTMATTRPSSCRRRTASTLPSGSTSAITSSMPTTSATACAVRALSPVSSTGVRPRDRSSATAAAEVGLTVSATTSTARTTPSQPASTVVRPAAAARVLGRGQLVGQREAAGVEVAGPAGDDQPARRPRPWTPRPAVLAKSSTGASSPSSASRGGGDGPGDGVLAGRLDRPRRRPGPRAGRAPGPGTTSTRAIDPVVTVPVLSRTIVSTRRVDSSTSGPLIRMPSWAPRPVPTSRAVGVARPRAQGQAMIRTATAAVKAISARLARRPARRRGWPAARPRTTGTNTADTRSARRCTGALPLWASVTSRPMRASAVSAPTRVARTTRRPPALTVPPVTASPGPTSTGHALAGQERGVDGRRALLDHAVGGHLLAGADDEAVADAQVLDRPAAPRRPSRRMLTSLAPRSSRARRAAPERRRARASR